MNDEEKKAVEFIRDLIAWDVRQYLCPNKEECKNLEIILNLIEKQQKKIENLKKLMAHKNGYTKQLEEDLFENASNYVVSKDKIRDKIEELNKESKDLIKKGNFESRNDGFEATDIEGLNDLINYQSKGIIIKILQELLEEE